jgi:hypothetical protein
MSISGNTAGPTPPGLSRTKPASEAERADLKAELERIGYELDEKQRIPRNSFAIMRAALQAMRQAGPGTLATV